MNLTFWNVDKHLSQVNLGLPKCIIDLSDVDFFEPFALIYLGMYLRHYNNQGKAFEVLPPTARRPREYLVRIRFWERFNFDPETIARENLLRFTSTTSLNDILDIEKTQTVAEDISDAVLRVLHHSGANVNRTRVAEMAAELVDNFAQHSGRSLAAFTMQYYPNLKRVVLAIGDCGKGIWSTLSANPKYAFLKQRPHNEAALKAFDPLVSCRGEGGTGLTEVADGVIEEDGELLLSTGDGFVRLRHDGWQVGYMHLDLPGVQIQLSFPER